MRAENLDSPVHRVSVSCKADSMDVNFYGTYRQITGIKQVEFNLPTQSTLRELLALVIQTYPALEHEILDPEGNLFPYIPIYINGRNPRLNQGMDAVLHSSDVVSLFSPVSSGHINVEDTVLKVQTAGTLKRNK